MSEGILLSRLLRGFHLLRGFPIFKGVGGNYHPVSLLSVVSKVFEKPVNNRIVDHLEKCCLFLISSMVLGLLDQLQVLSQLYPIELLGF